MLSALVTVNANCVSALTQRQGNKLVQFTVVPGVPIVRLELGSSSKSDEVGVGIDTRSLDVVSIVLGVRVSETGTIFDPTPRAVSASLVVLGVTSLIIVSVQALSNRQPVRTKIPLMCNLYTKHSLMKYV